MTWNFEVYAYKRESRRKGIKVLDYNISRLIQILSLCWFPSAANSSRLYKLNNSYKLTNYVRILEEVVITSIRKEDVISFQITRIVPIVLQGVNLFGIVSYKILNILFWDENL